MTELISLLQKNAVVAARQNLNLAMGRDPKTQIEIKTDIEIKGEYSEVDSLISRGLAYNPEIQKNEATVNSNSRQVSRSYGVLWPALRLFFNYNRSNEAFNRVWSYSGLDKNWGTNYGVNLSLNLFNGLRDKTRIQKAKLQERNAQETYEQSKRSLRSKINQLVETTIPISRLLLLMKKTWKPRRKNTVWQRRDTGSDQGHSLEVREAQVNLNRAELTLVQAKYSALVAQSQMEKALGIVTAEMAGGNE